MKTKISLMILILMVIAGTVFADSVRDRPVTQYQYSVTVTNSSTKILSENLKGRDIIIQNNDAAGIVYLNFSGAATVSGTMLKLDPGDSITAINTTNAVYAIGSVASNANVAVSEGK